MAETKSKYRQINLFDQKAFNDMRDAFARLERLAQKDLKTAVLYAEYLQNKFEVAVNGKLPYEEIESLEFEIDQDEE